MKTKPEFRKLIETVIFCLNSWQFYPCPKIFYASAIFAICDEFQKSDYGWEDVSIAIMLSSNMFLDALIIGGNPTILKLKPTYESDSICF